MTNAVLDPAAPTDTAHQTRSRHILSAAANCFARSGFHGTSMQEICQEAAMSPGAVYRYFRSKDEIINAIAEEERTRNLALLSQDSGGKPFVEHLLELGMMFLSEMARPGQAALLAEVMAECLRNSAIGQMFEANEAECRQIFRDLIVNAVAQGEIDAPADFDAAMTCMMAIGDGLALRMAADPSLTIDRIEPLLRRIGLALFPPVRASGSVDPPMTPDAYPGKT